MFRYIMLLSIYAYVMHNTNRFCVVQEYMKPEVLEVQTELARSIH